MKAMRKEADFLSPFQGKLIFIDPRSEHCDQCVHWMTVSEKIGFEKPVAKCQKCYLVWVRIEEGDDKGKWTINRKEA
jgi:hypothetical protein